MPTWSVCPSSLVRLCEDEQRPKCVKGPVECYHAGEGAALCLGNEELGETGKNGFGDIQMPDSQP